MNLMNRLSLQAMRATLSLLALLTASSLASAQDDTTLRQSFEGRPVVVKIDMPGTQEGVEIQPAAEIPLEIRKLANSIKRYGIAIHQGDQVMITKVLVKGDHIEFQLAGGGFGVMADTSALSSAYPAAPLRYESSRERELQDQIRNEKDRYRRDRLQDDLDRMRRQRERDNTAITAQNAIMTQQRNAREAELRLKGGSRFNIKYPKGIPEGAATPEGIRKALAEYVDFNTQTQSAIQNVPEPPPANDAVAQLQMGQTIAQVEALLGPAELASQKQEGSITVMTREYSVANGRHVSAQFVSGVLTSFTVKP